MPRRSSPNAPPRRGPETEPEPEVEFGVATGELLRKAALGLTAALIVARMFWPGELVREEHSASGSSWIAALFVALGLALASMLVGGRARVRWSGADGAFYLLMFLVGLSSARGAERRVAINLAWEWGGVAIAYFLARTLPRSRAETTTLLGAIMATAVAISAYGLYQATVELPADRAYYRAHKAEALKIAGVMPGTPEQAMFEARLLASNEATSTFALANSLAGFLVGPAVLGLAIGLEALRRRERGDSPGVALLLGALPWLVILACLLLTKSRSATLGLAAGAGVLAWRARGRLPGRTIAVVGVGGIALVGLFVGAGVASGRLDREVVTQATLSFRYRLEYWRGAWGVLTEEPGAFWRGVGPGNFGGAYLRHKLPEASEEVADPHNLLLEAWTTAGLFAALALAAALGLGLRETLGPPRREARVEPPGRASWLLLCAGGGWFLAAHLGTTPPMDAYLSARWTVLLLGGAWAALMGLPAWRRLDIPPYGLGAAALALAVNLLAAGGIGFTPVALGLWLAIALGQDLRDDRPCGALRDLGGRGPAFGLAVVGVALFGTFLGALRPAWDAEAAMALATQAAEHQPPRFQEAVEALETAREADRYSARPWLNLAEVEFRRWQSRGRPVGDAAWLRIDAALLKAVSPPRNPDSLAARRREAGYARQILEDRGAALPESTRKWLRERAVNALGHAVRLYPTSAALRAELAEASADAGRDADAIREARVALDLDRKTPHPDKRLGDEARTRLVAELRRWEEAVRDRDESR